MKAMRLDGQSQKRGSHFELVKLRGHWHVVGPGYVRMVDGYTNGVRLIERLRAKGQRYQVSIRQPQHGTHAS